jgi:DNA-binding transcriptional ArsR family regulator
MRATGAAGSLDFPARKASDSALSKQLSTLEAAGYVHLERQLNGRRLRCARG